MTVHINLLISCLRQFMGNDQIVDSHEINYIKYSTEQRGNFASNPAYVIFPKNTAELAKIITHCNDFEVGVVPQGGNSGLVGGSVAGVSEIIINSKLMNSIVVNPSNLSCEVGAGAILADVKAECNKHNLFFPLTLPSQHKCTIGGNIATNAGGINVLKYGSTKDNILGIEAVLPNGDIYSDLNTLRKRNIGSDFKHLLIGSEGLMGFVSKATMKLFPKPKKSIHILLSIASINNLHAMFQAFYQEFYPYLSAFEIFNSYSLHLAQKYYPSNFFPIKRLDNHWYVLATLDLYNDSIDFSNTITNQINQVISNNKFSDNYYITENDKIWDTRLCMSDAQKQEGFNIKHDISVPIDKIIAFIQETEVILAEKYNNKLILVIFGHMGDGNLHYNISLKDGDNINDLRVMQNEIRAIVIKQAIKFNGTFSAEHGVGQIYTEQLKEYYYNNQYFYLKKLKHILDPKNIFNRNKVIVN